MKKMILFCLISFFMAETAFAGELYKSREFPPDELIIKAYNKLSKGKNGLPVDRIAGKVKLNDYSYTVYCVQNRGTSPYLFKKTLKLIRLDNNLWTLDTGKFGMSIGFIEK